MSRRATTWLLAAAGVIVGHLLGYAVAHPAEADRAMALAGHAYLGPASVVIVPVGAVALLGIAIRTVRQLGDVPTVSELASVQVVFFAAQELIERIPGPGAPVDALSERGVWLGFVAQVLVAWISVRLIRATARLVRAVTGGAPPRTSATPVRVLPAPAPTPPCRPVALRLPARRGPPWLLRAAMSS